jgi:hypothetical protein
VPHLIYVHSAGQYDRGRWLHIELRDDGQLAFHLQDLCHPGRLSQLQQVSCPTEFVVIALDRGTLQITANSGYLLMRPSGEHLSVEFRGLDDIATHKVTVLRDEVRNRLTQLLGDLDRSTAGRR